MRSPSLILLCLLPLVSTLSARGTGPDLGFVKRWIAHQSGLRSIRAEFIQERQLRSLKRPLTNPGRFFFSAGAFRWELGDPAQTIALQAAGGDMTVLRPAKREARRFTAEQLTGEGAARGFSFIDAGFPRTYESFAKNFTITAVEREGDSHVFTARLNDRRASLALRKIVFTVDVDSLRLQQFYLRFRDGSSITTRFTAVHENVKVDASLFKADLKGYKVVADR